MAYKSVVVGTDGSQTAELAVRHAGGLAADSEARLVIVTAYEPKGDHLVGYTEGVPADLQWTLTDRNQAEELARRGRQLATESGAKAVVAQAIAGGPAEVLLETAHDYNADLIVVGSKGLTRAAGFGSVASS